VTNAERFQEAARVFEACREKSGPERLAALRELCGADEPLRLEVEELLAAHDREGDPVRTGGSAGLRGPLAADPERVGRYEILGRLGAGGMGVVYRARQASPAREVALKVLPAGALSAAARSRFEHESLALARLDHPGIAGVHEAGVAPDENGVERAFFAMELVEGAPITAAASGMSLAERSGLLADVAEAVQHAHSRGVIHRDLKPSNILVDGEGRAHVLDFGVARLADVETPSSTVTGQIIGTVQYMSPEQASGDPGAVDTRTDVYALGMLLYELAAGRPPYDVRGMSVLKAVKAVAESSVAPIGSSPARGASAELVGDLSVIARKALEKDPGRRYQTASALAEDLRRALSNEPILAHPPSTVYQLRKFVRRNRAMVALGGVAVVAVVVGVVGLAVGLTRAQRAEASAVASAAAARDAEGLALERLGEARLEQEKAEAVRDFLREMLSSVDPLNTEDRELTVAEAIDGAVARIEAGALADRPVVRGTVLRTVGQTYRSLGKPDEAEAALADAVAALEGAGEPRELGPALTSLAGTRLDRNAFEEAEPIYRRAIEVFETSEELAGQIPMAMDGLGLAVSGQGRRAEALEIFERALPLHVEHHGDPSLETAKCRNNIGTISFYLGDYESAAAAFEAAMADQVTLVGESHPDVLMSLSNLGVTYNQLGRVEDALETHRRSVELRKRRFGPEHPETFYGYHGYASALRGVGRHEEAVGQFDEAIRVVEAAYGPDHLQAAASWFGRAQALRELKRYEESHESYARSAAIREKGGDFAQAAVALDSAAYVLQLAGDYGRAEAAHERAVAFVRESVPEDDPRRGEVESSALMSLGHLRFRQARYGEAAEGFGRAVEVRREHFGDGHGRVGEALCRYGQALLELGRDEEAARALEESAETMRRVVGEDHWLHREASGALGRSVARLGDAARGIELMEAAYAALAPDGVRPQQLFALCADLRAAHAALGDAEAEALWAEREEAHRVEMEAAAAERGAGSSPSGGA